MSQEYLVSSIERALEYVRTENIQLSEATQRALDELNDPNCSIVVAGPFQVGKSTLINKVLLEDDVLLCEGDGRCTTAVAAKVAYGQEKTLRVHYSDPSRVASAYSAEQIDAQLLASLTTVDDPNEIQRQEQRLQLAQEIQYIELTAPQESLRNVTFYDTPGIDDPNQELVETTTFQFIPECDLVVLVVDAKRTLDEATRSFLSRSIFQEGHSRVIVLASYRPHYGKTAEDIRATLDGIRAELQGIGRGYVSVWGYTYDPNVEGELLHSAAEIRCALLEFIENNRMSARRERLAWLLRLDLLQASERLHAALEIRSLNVQERVEASDKLQSLIDSLDAEYQSLIADFQTQFQVVKYEALQELRAKLTDEHDSESALNVLMDQFHNCDSYMAFKARVPVATQLLKREVDYILSQVSAKMRERVQEILQGVCDKLALCAGRFAIDAQWHEEINSGWCAKLPGAVMRLLDNAVGFLIFGLYGALGVEILRKIPFLKMILPTNWARVQAIKRIRSSYLEGADALVQALDGQFEQAAFAVQGAIQESFQDMYKIQVAPYLEELNQEQTQAFTPEEEEIVRQKQASLNELAQQLDCMVA